MVRTSIGAVLIVLLAVNASACSIATPITPKPRPRPVASDPLPQEGYQIGPVFQTGERSPIAQADAAPAAAVATGISGGRVALTREVNGETHVVVFEASDGTTVDAGDMPVWAGPAAPHVSADGRFVTYEAVTTGFGGRLVLWDVEKRQEVPLPGVTPGDCREPDLDATGAHLIFLTGSSLSPGLAVYDVATGTERALDVPADAFDGVRTPTLSGDARRAAYVAASKQGDDDVYVLDVASGLPVTAPTLDSVDQDTDPALSQDGRVVLFSSDRGASSDLYAYDLAQAGYLDLGSFNTLADETQPRFLGTEPDGLAYVSTRDGSPRLYIRPFQGWR